MQIVESEDLSYTSLVQCHLKYPIVTATDVEQDIAQLAVIAGGGVEQESGLGRGDRARPKDRIDHGAGGGLGTPAPRHQ